MAPEAEISYDGSRIATLKVQAPKVHIYPFSRLVNAPAGKWEKLLNEIEAKQKIVNLYYQPAREAIVKYTAKKGSGRDKLHEDMCVRAAAVTHLPTQNPVKDNREAFSSFEEGFFPKIYEFRRSLLRAPNLEGTYFEGIILTGLPHMVVSDRRGRDRYVHLYPSSWKSHDLDAHMELLTIIVESQFGGDAADLWCMNLKSGQSISRPKSKSRTRQACREAAKHLKRIVEGGLVIK